MLFRLLPREKHLSSGAIDMWTTLDSLSTRWRSVQTFDGVFEIHTMGHTVTRMSGGDTLVSWITGSYGYNWFFLGRVIFWNLFFFRLTMVCYWKDFELKFESRLLKWGNVDVVVSLKEKYVIEQYSAATTTIPNSTSHGQKRHRSSLHYWHIPCFSKALFPSCQNLCITFV